MRRFVELFVLMGLAAPAWAGPGSASGPIAVDSTTFTPGSSVMGTDGGFYSSSPSPVGTGTTAAFGMTRFRAEHVNLRDASGAELGTSGNPLYTTASSTITIGNVTILNSSFSVTGSTVNIAGTVPVSVAGTLNVSVSNQPTVKVSSTSVSGSTVTITNTGFNVNNTPFVHFADTLPAGSNNIGTVSGSTVTIRLPANTSLPTTLSSAIPAGANVIGQVTAAQITPQSLQASVYINGSSNTVTATQTSGGNLHVNVDNFKSSMSVTGSSVTAYQGGTWTLTAPVGISSVTFAGIAQPVSVQNGSQFVPVQPDPTLNRASVFISGSSNTVQSQQSGAWTNTVTQATGSNLRASVSIDASSNTVQAQQSGSWTSTVTQSTPANLRASVMIDGSSNTVVLGAGTANVGKVLFQTPTTASLSSIAINASSTGDNVIVSTASAQTVRVFRMIFTASAATTVTFKSGGATNLTGAMTLTAGGAFVIDFSGEPWFVTAASQAFIINQTGTAQLSGVCYYTQS